jgi:long-chain acyl-CoA synthetase
MVEHVLMFFGVTLGYGSPRTLTDVSIRNCKSDIQEFRPSILAGVPTVWETIRKGALHRVETGPAINRFLFRLAFATKLAHSEGRIPVFGGVLSYLFDKIVFSKFRANVGGRPNFFVAGGAPLSKETHQFMRICMGRPFIQGYGLTETCGITTAQDETDEG